MSDPMTVRSLVLNGELSLEDDIINKECWQNIQQRVKEELIKDKQKTPESIAEEKAAI